jgi:hypothetical protein
MEMFRLDGNRAKGTIMFGGWQVSLLKLVRAHTISNGNEKTPG